MGRYRNGVGWWKIKLTMEYGVASAQITSGPEGTPYPGTEALISGLRQIANRLEEEINGDALAAPEPAPPTPTTTEPPTGATETEEL